ncbi:putative cyclin dependent kinase binding protein [Babesia divergens]|uniref:Cyclin dependent kinase binding protein n=1 Tax=Babesia divergens TaxID=32595 RepID=A0AAD9GFW4_BABDI|nr:putative cyclin dependent kinase binding protein [Babesia divergens]
MPRNTCAIDDYTLPEFQELLADLRFTSLKTANLSTNVAVAFLTGIPHVSRNAEVLNIPTASQDMISQNVSTPRDKCMLDHDNFIELEDDRHERQIAADEEALRESLATARFAPGYDGDDSAVSIKSKVRYWGRRITSSLRGYRNRKSNSLDNIAMRHGDLEQMEVKPKRKFYISYAELIIPSQDTYNPDFLHVPLYYGLAKMRHGARAASSHATQLIHDDDIGDHYVGPDGSKHDLTPTWEVNNRFRQSNEWLHPSLSLTKLSRIKLMLFLAPRRVSYLDPSTVASAWILFERLVIKGTVTKANRKLYAATCLILSYKFNQDGEQVVINEIMAYLCRDRSINARAIFATEMKVFTLLEFSLKQSYSGMCKHVQHYLDFNRITFMDLYEVPESTYLNLENAGEM